ncbi:MAG: hypothetical protein ACOVOX_03950 [Burkholderiaceae bacterium]
MITASPWDVLLKAPAIRLGHAEHVLADCDQGGKLATLLAILVSSKSLPTNALAARAEMNSRQIWGLLKAPRAAGQVVFNAGRWALVPDYPGRDVQRAADLLRSKGWHVEPPAA